MITQKLVGSNDLQLSYKLAKLGLLPPGKILPRFAVRKRYRQRGVQNESSGLHKPWNTPWISPTVIAQLLEKPFERIQALESVRDW